MPAPTPVEGPDVVIAMCKREWRSVTMEIQLIQTPAAIIVDGLGAAMRSWTAEKSATTATPLTRMPAATRADALVAGIQL